MTRRNTSETADGGIAGADLGEEGGGQLGGVTGAPTSLLRPTWHRVFLTSFTHVSEHFFRDKGCIHPWKLWGSCIYLPTGDGLAACHGK